jgi:glycine cleavage system aminomethyltransferase T
MRFGQQFEPYEYTDWIDESMSWKTHCYIGDWSPLMKLRIQGPEALDFFSGIIVNSVAKFDVGQAKHATLPNSDGKVMGEGILMRLAEDDFLFTSGPGSIWVTYKFAEGDFDATLTNVTAERSIQQVQGPTSLELMEEAAGEDLRDIGFMRFRPSSIAGKNVLLLRQGMAGEVGYEIHGNAEEAPAVYQHILELGRKYGIRRLGGRTKMVNHVEACFPTPTVDYVPAWYGFDEEQKFRAHVKDAGYLPYEYFSTNSGSHEGPVSELFFSPVELGWARSINGNHEFPGREVLLAEKESPVRGICTLVWNDEDVADVLMSYFRKDADPYDFMEWPRDFLGNVVADKVLVDGRQIGLTTSRCYSYYFREMLSLGVLETDFLEPGIDVEVVWGRPSGRQKTIRAKVAPAPYKTDRRKTDLTAAGTK